MNTQDCILTRRSVRKFTNEPAAPEAIEQVVSLAAFAPSWKNTQVSRYLAVIEPEDARKSVSMYPTITRASSISARCCLRRLL